jgi:NAD(P)-dependent dehydrogenase (short-subunit alcohol dehydrogenase family)
VTILDRFRLDGRTAIVTGASSGLGVAFALALGQAGANLVLGARRRDGLEKTKRLVEEAGAHAVALPADVSDPNQCAGLVEEAMRAFGRVDILVNNAGLGTAVPATREKPEQFDEVIRVNLHGSYFMAQECGRVMRPGSAIINVSSVLGMTTAGLPQAAYSASKSALFGLTRDLASQWSGRKGIRVNAVVPGFFPSEMTAQYEPGYVESLMARVPLSRQGEPEEVAAAVLFLAGDGASYITGQALVVDGGFTIA